jgi:exosome complex component RRP4
VAGTLTRTNKLLTVRPLHARYTPEIGDLVVGRVVEVQARRWRVDVGAAHHATLQLSAINLPGGVLRRRTDTDELQIRAFFAEGDLLVAEVQQLHSSTGEASLHARSLRYGKLRNGIFVAVRARGGTGGGVVRARRHVWTMHGRGTTAIDVVLGVNGYVWVCKHVEGGVAGKDGEDGGGAGSAGGVGNSSDDGVSAAAYSSQNEDIDVPTMREITRARGVIMALAENGVRVDEDMVRRAYAEALEMPTDPAYDEIYLGGARGKQLVRALAL